MTSVASAQAQRDALILVLYMEGRSLQEVGDIARMTRERVRQICASHGLTAREGGKSVSKAQQDQARLEQREERVRERYGLSLAEYREVPSSAKAAYQQQRKNAKAFGYAWALSLSEWLNIWCESGRLTQRGLGAGKFFLGRINRSKPFQLGNVKVIEHCASSSMPRRRWKKRKGHDAGDGAQ